MQILILGGTGAMGVHLVKILAERGDQITVTSRQKREPEHNITYLQGNAHNTDFLNELLTKKWDAIVDFMVYNTAEFKTRIDKLLAATKQYVYLSSARVYADSDSPITEESPRLLDVCKDKEYCATDEYALTKARQENVLKETGKTNWTIIRPYITYSENRLQLGVLEKEEWLYRALHGRTIVFSKDINDRLTTLTYGFDVAKGIAAVVGKKNTLGEVFHITAPKAIYWNKVLNLYLKTLKSILGYQPNVFLTDIKKFTEIHPAKYQIEYDRLFNRQFETTKVAKLLDVNDFKEIENGLTACLKEFLINPKFKNINWKNEARKDKQTKERTPLSEIQGIKPKIKYIIYRYILTTSI